MPTPEERLQQLGVTLPVPAAPVAAYVPCVRSGDLVYVSVGHNQGQEGLKVSKEGDTFSVKSVYSEKTIGNRLGEG